MYQYDGLGRRVKETDANDVDTDYIYDDRGNLLSKETDRIIVQSGSYDLLGNQLTMTDGNGNITTFSYNALDKVREMTLPGDSSIAAYTVNYKYTRTGQAAREADSLGKEILNTYDNHGRPLSRTQQRLDQAQTITILSSYDRRGNLRFRTDGRGNITEYTPPSPMTLCTGWLRY